MSEMHAELEFASSSSCSLREREPLTAANCGLRPRISVTYNKELPKKREIERKMRERETERKDGLTRLLTWILFFVTFIFLVDTLIG